MQPSLREQTQAWTQLLQGSKHTSKKLVQCTPNSPAQRGGRPLHHSSPLGRGRKPLEQQIGTACWKSVTHIYITCVDACTHTYIHTHTRRAHVTYQIGVVWCSLQKEREFRQKRISAEKRSKEGRGGALKHCPLLAKGTSRD